MYDVRITYTEKHITSNGFKCKKKANSACGFIMLLK